MIHHLSIAARDPQRAAGVLAELMGGKAVPFPPNPGSFFALQLDEHGSGVEVYPAGTELEPNGSTGGPNGGTVPGTRPVRSFNSSAVANRVFLTPRWRFTAAESSLRSAGRTNSRNTSSVLRRSALPPVCNSSPRAFADSSEVWAGSWRTSRNETPASMSSRRMASRTALAFTGESLGCCMARSNAGV